MTAGEYWENVALVESLNPGELLLPAVRNGFTRVNEAYLAAALKRLPAPVEDEDSEISTNFLNIGIPADETLRAMWTERTRLFGEMNALSNKFHDCRTDDARAANSKLIMKVWERILEVKADIQYYSQHNRLPDPLDEGDQLPDNPVALSKKLASIRSRISQKKQQIREIAALDESREGKQAQIDAAEDDLKRLKHQAGLAEQKLKTHEETA